MSSDKWFHDDKRLQVFCNSFIDKLAATSIGDEQDDKFLRSLYTVRKCIEHAEVLNLLDDVTVGKITWYFFNNFKKRPQKSDSFPDQERIKVKLDEILNQYFLTVSECNGQKEKSTT